MPLVPTVAPGQIISSSAWGNLVGPQTVMRFATAAQRTSQLTAPQLGQLTSLDTAPGLIEAWNGTAWVVAPAGGWTAYTPTLTGDTGASTIGNGTITGRYQLLAEKTLAVLVNLAMGSTTSLNAGSVRFGLPPGLSVNTAHVAVGSAHCAVAAGTFIGSCTRIDATRLRVFLPTSATSTAAVVLNSTNLNATSQVFLSLLTELA